MISEFIDRQATNTDLFELEDVLTGEKRQYRIVSKATVTVPGTDLNKATLDPILEAILSAAGIADSGGSASTGYWVKYDDGTMICYKRTTIMPNAQTAMGDFYRSDYISLGDFPAAFTTHYLYTTGNMVCQLFDFIYVVYSRIWTEHYICWQCSCHI